MGVKSIHNVIMERMNQEIMIVRLPVMQYDDEVSTKHSIHVIKAEFLPILQISSPGGRDFKQIHRHQ